MRPLATYLSAMARVRGSGEASDETSFYSPFVELINEVGDGLKPSVHCVLTPRNQGAGIPDGALFLKRSLAVRDREDGFDARAPERGVVEVKGLSANLERIAKSQQVGRYLKHYGQVLLTNYREFALVRYDGEHKVTLGERFVLAGSEDAFWSLCDEAEIVEGLEESFGEFLIRVLLADAPLSSPADLAGFLAGYARLARSRLDSLSELPALETLRGALESALGLRFEGEKGDEFFRSALIQTLFYGVFASWVKWSAGPRADAGERFSWRTAQWTLRVPMVRALFDQLVTPRTLPAGLDEILDWTEDVFARVEREEFFERFEQREAVRYFYEPFLQAYDPELRKELGVWYTPPEVVRYMVARVDEALKRDLSIPKGLADERVHVLDPCTGTGSFLIEALRVAVSTLEAEHGDELVAEEVKDAALRRFHGFEILPAPFIVTHLQLGLFLADLGAPLDDRSDERPSVFLTNALTGWSEEGEQLMPFEEFQNEREAAGNVKRTEPILVVIGNPPYNGFTGVGEEPSGDLVAPYKEGLAEEPWEITKNKLDDYYVRFFRVAERRIAEQTGRGIISFISNFGWLGDPSAVLMRRHLINAFDQIYIDNLNGDSRETGKKTPSGAPDPSIFASRIAGGGGIQVGAAMALLVKRDGERSGDVEVRYRDLWGAEKAAELEASLGTPQEELPYELLEPDEKNWYRLRTWKPRPGYESWPSLNDLSATKPELGLNENRGEALVDPDRDVLVERMQSYFDASKDLDELAKGPAKALTDSWSGYQAEKTRERLLKSGFDERRIGRFATKPFEHRWAYLDKTPGLWNRPRPRFQAAAVSGADFIYLRRRSPRAMDGAALLHTRHLADQHVLHKDAYAIPTLASAEAESEHAERLFDLDASDNGADRPWRPNLSRGAIGYLLELGFHDIGTSRSTARMVWMHALAMSYSPLYLEENADALRHDWPRIPLPSDRSILEDSAGLGERIAALLEIDTPLPGVDTSCPLHLEGVGRLRDDGHVSSAPAKLEVAVGWGTAQIREQKSGATSRIVMPGVGRAVRRSRNPHETERNSPQQEDLLGEDVLDLYLNDACYFGGIPEAAWNYKIGGFPVLRKWLSYRESSILGRPLTIEEARQFQSICRRVSELVLLGPALDSIYRAATGSFDQDSLLSIAAEA